MGKNPAFQFHPNDWSRDLEEHSLEIEGAWIRICCKLWWSETRGKLERNLDQWAKVLRVYPQDAERILNYINLYKIGDISVDPNGNITVISRRILKDEKERENNCLRQKRHYVKKNTNVVITEDSQPSSSSSSTSIKKESIKKDKIEFNENHFINIPGDLKEKWKSIAPGISLNTEITKAEAWVLSNPKLKKSNWSRFLTNWIVRAQDHVTKYGGNNGNTGNKTGFKTNSYRFNNNNRELDPKIADECDRITAKYFPQEKTTDGNT